MHRRLVVAAIAAMLTFAGLAAYTADRVFTTEPVKPSVPVRPAYCDNPEGEGIAAAGSVAAIFVRSTVFSDGKRIAPECSYDLVTDRIRQGKTRAQWRAGRISVPPFVVDYLGPEYVGSYAVDGSVKAVYRTPLGLHCEVESETCLLREVSAVIVVEGVHMQQRLHELFHIRLVYGHGGWKVDLWQADDAGANGGAMGPSTIR